MSELTTGVFAYIMAVCNVPVDSFLIAVLVTTRAHSIQAA